MLTVATWNVLHRTHANNWQSEVAERWPSESDRIKAVTSAIAQRTERVIALQEVSGDQLASLRQALPDRAFHVLRYPRVPKPRRPVPSLAAALTDGTEQLVLVVAGESREVLAEVFANDHGNGSLTIEVDGVLITATHVTGDGRRDPQFARLAELAGNGEKAVILGDFNADRRMVAAGLGPGFTVAEVSEAIPTRPRTGDSKSQYIDHVVVRGISVRDTVVEDVAGVSDHNLVRATVG
ncbi:endonuclease/exonuclease/phosphatase family protein [Nocardia inohanensis]|uniref:endonuclease/exonuclease/phosphatase family protein n=1 Tax=Nocardia inohanensis TaxID=209246 RepID=UPI00082C8EFB|nr:endonuclease/exonuclease/phosphatase family protein [Nocardia inohanensis]